MNKPLHLETEHFSPRGKLWRIRRRPGLRDRKKKLWKRSVGPCGSSALETRRKGSFTGTLRMYKVCSETGISLHTGPFANMDGRSLIWVCEG